MIWDELEEAAAQLLDASRRELRRTYGFHGVPTRFADEAYFAALEKALSKREQLS